MPLEYTRIQAQVRGAASPALVEIAINAGRNDGEMRFAEPVHHFGHDGAGLRHGGSSFDLGPQFIVHRDPVDAAKAGIPVLVADGGPDELEGFDIEPLLAGRKRGFPGVLGAGE